MATMERTLGTHCLGCGLDVTDRPAERRNLRQCPNVVRMWKDTVIHSCILDSEGVDINELDIDIYKMCHSCYSAFTRLHTLQSSIHHDLTQASGTIKDSLFTAVTPPKRPRLASTVGNMGLVSASSSEPTSSKLLKSRSPDVAVYVGYKNPKTFILTPQRKHLGKAVARKSKKAIAVECMKDPKVAAFLIKFIGQEVHKEIRLMASTETASILGSQSKDDLISFTWTHLHEEMTQYAPVLYSILCAATKSRVTKCNTKGVIGMCAAMLIRHRNPAMSLLQKILSLVLYAGRTAKKSIQRLQRLHICVSYQSLLRLVDKVGEKYDAEVQRWRDNIIMQLNSSSEVEPVSECHTTLLRSEDDDQLSVSSDSSYDSDTSHPQYSPVTSDAESSSDLEFESEFESESEEENEDDSSGQTITTCSHHERISDGEATCSGNLLMGSSSFETLYRLCGDNIDKTVKQRYMRSNTQAQSIHYFHSYAVSSRVNTSGLSQKTPSVPTVANQVAKSLLPTPEDDTALRANIAILVSRVLVNNLAYFKLTYDGVVQWHIQHKFFKEMATKSEVVPLGILPKNENKGSEMVEIMSTLHKYTPFIENYQDVVIPSLNTTVKVPSAKIQKILFGEDQLTAARARGAQKAKVNADAPTARLEGLVPVAEDWHTKVILLEVIWKHFYSYSSGGEHGTLYQLRNKLNRTNVLTKPTKDVNACEDFFDLMISGHIIAAALKVLKMKSLNDRPSEDIIPGAENVWMLNDDERRTSLTHVCEQVVDYFIDTSFNHLPVLQLKEMAYQTMLGILLVQDACT